MEGSKVLCGSPLVRKMEGDLWKSYCLTNPHPKPWSISHFTDRKVGRGDEQKLHSEVGLQLLKSNLMRGSLGMLEVDYILTLGQISFISHSKYQTQIGIQISPFLSSLSLYSSSIEEALKVEVEDQILKGSIKISWAFIFKVWFLSLLGFLSLESLPKIIFNFAKTRVSI